MQKFAIVAFHLWTFTYQLAICEHKLETIDKFSNCKLINKVQKTAKIVKLSENSVNVITRLLQVWASDANIPCPSHHWLKSRDIKLGMVTKLFSSIRKSIGSKRSQLLMCNVCMCEWCIREKQYSIHTDTNSTIPLLQARFPKTGIFPFEYFKPVNVM